MTLKLSNYDWNTDPETPECYVTEGNYYAGMTVTKDPDTLNWNVTMLIEHAPTREDTGYLLHEELDDDFACFESAANFAIARDLKELSFQLEYEARMTEYYLDREYEEVAE